MAYEIMAAYKEFVDRLENSANQTGTGDYGLLEGVTLIEGPIETVIEDKNLPAIVYEILNGGFAEDTCFPRGMRYKLTVMLTVIVHESQGYYNAGKTGMIDLFEKVVSVIDGPLQTDLTGNNHWGPIPPQYRVGGFEKDGLRYTYLVEVEIQTPRYTKGSLQP